MKKITILGSTGSVGRTTIAVARHLGIEVVGLTAFRDVEGLSKQIELLHPKVVALVDRKGAAEVRKRYPHLRVLEGEEGVCEVASLPGVDQVMVSIVGVAALAPTLAAIDAGHAIAFASKEVLVSAGHLVMQRVREKGIAFLPVDSEHSAIFQVLNGQSIDKVRRVIITSSGGPFLNKTAQELEQVTREQALKHPTWTMGAKVTIDSSTLMNKALEMIEAYHLFSLPIEKIEVMIHPQSLIHCMVEWIDGNLFTHLHPPEMSYPVQYALTYPSRAPAAAPPFDFTKHSRIDFLPPDRVRFPAIDFAKEALHVGKSMACYLNAANEVLVSRFLDQRISWREISTKLEILLARHSPYEIDTLEAVLAVDQQARQEALTS